MENMYDLDVAHHTIARMMAIKSRQYNDALSMNEKEKLEKEIKILREEKNALYYNNDFQLSVIDKAFKVYGPFLKAYKNTFEYATVGS